MRRFGLIGLVALILAVGEILVMAATTYTAPPPASSRSTWGTNRYATPVEGLMVVDVVTTAVTDQTVTLDSTLAGYLERVVYSHNGNDASWKLYVKDKDGINLFSDLDTSAATDPCCYDIGGRGFAFADGLSVQIADADDGTGDAITVRLYIREAWRR